MAVASTNKHMRLQGLKAAVQRLLQPLSLLLLLLLHSVHGYTSNGTFARCEIFPPNGPGPVPTSYIINKTCAIGHVCFASRTNNTQSTAAGPLVGTCLPCLPGQFCATASQLEPIVENRLTSGCVFPCPAGYHCRTPDEQLPCPAGTFCPEGSRQKFPCTIQGSFCPRLSASGGNLCPAGSFCTTPATIEVCPAGFYCVLGSTAPENCPTLASCPPGASKPTISLMGIIVLSAVIVGLGIWAFLMYRVTERARREAVRMLAARARADVLFTRLAERMGINAAAAEKFFHGFAAVSNSVNVSFSKLSLRVPGVDHPILSDISGEFPAGVVTAVMGSSGCGKSSLLQVILGRAADYGTIEGRVLVNGREVNARDICQVANLGFAPQTNDVHSKLSVRENIEYSARIRLSAPSAQRTAVVDDIVRLLDLGPIQHSVVGGDTENRGISGGQRARVSLGMELASYPSVLLADEPTSGLDAASSLEVMAALQRLARLGMCVVVVIHQPRTAVFDLFDRLMLLDEGRVVYSGKARRVRPYLESLGFACPPNENIADFMIDVVTGNVESTAGDIDEEKTLADLWDERHAGADDPQAAQQQQQDEDETSVLVVTSSQPTGIGAVPLELMEQKALEDDDVEEEEVEEEEEEEEEKKPRRAHTLTRSMVEDLRKDVSVIGLQPKEVYTHDDLLDIVAFFGDYEDVRNIVERFFGVEDPATFSITHSELLKRLSSSSNSNNNNDSNKDSVTLVRQKTLSKPDSAVGQARPRPSFVVQVWHFTARMASKLKHMKRMFLLDVALTTAGAGLLSAMYGNDFSLFRWPGVGNLTSLMFGLLAAAGGMRTFSLELDVFKREAGSGISTMAYFLANNIVWLGELGFRSLLFAATLYSFMEPKTHFPLFWSTILLVGWCGTAIGQLVVMLFAPSSAVLAGIFLPLMMGGVLAGVDPPLHEVESAGLLGQALASASFGRWSTELFMAREAAEEGPVLRALAANEFADTYGLDVFNESNDIMGLLIIGGAVRLLTAVVMWRKHQK